MSQTAPVRIGNASGFYGDRLSAMREMLEGGELDYLTGDYLAELTMLILGRDRMKDPELGYAKTFVRQMRDCMALAQAKGVKIVTNAGGLNPAGCAAKLREIATEQSLNISIAHVEGDDLMSRAAEYGFGNVMTANAYLGAFGIATALEHGADIVVTGRVTDASVIVGPAIAHFGWGRESYDELASAVIAGHIIECGTHATGGNFSGFADIDRSKPLGFPIAEISADGTVAITKHAETGGAVTVDTVTAQLVYEIQSELYLNPDVTTHLDSLSIEQVGTDRVQLTGITGSPPPSDAKVSLNTVGGFRNSVEFILTGLDIDEKAAWIREQVEAALAKNSPEVVEWQLDRTDVSDPATQAAATTLLRCHVKSSDADAVGRAFTGAAIELALASYPGFSVTRPPGPAAPYGLYRAAYVPQPEVPHRVVFSDGSSQEIGAPITTEDHQSAYRSAATSMKDRGSTTDAPLGELVYTRSGDKGGNANVGVWIPADHPRRIEAYDWLRGFLDEEKVRQLLPEAADSNIEIYQLPNLAALNVVIEGLLGEGVASSTRFDPQAKALGEWLRARVVQIPTVLMPERTPR